MTKSKQPQYRFDGFEGEWEEKELGDIVQITMGQSPSSQNYTTNPSDYILVQGNADIKNGYVFPRVWTTQITKQADKGDIILSVRAPVGDVGKTNYHVIIGRGVAAIKGNEFIFQILKYLKEIGYWKRISTGSTFDSISSSDIKYAKIQIPSLPEQEAIGELFQMVDQLIQLQDQKLATLKEQKQTFLRKMFPAQGQKVPEIRLQGFKGEWEENKLGEVSPLRGGYAFESDKFQSDGIKIIRISNILSSGIIGGEFAHYHQINNDDKYLLTGGSALIAMSGATTGKVSILNTEEKYYQNQRVGYFMDLNKIHYNFIIAFLKSLNFNKQIQSVLVAGAQPNISSKEIDNFQILYPRHNVEQEAIGNFFQTLDQQIAQSEEKLTELKALKQTLLNRLFV
ncbi:restriction endonuclease subunit S [Streptococcus pyogenes]|uniref:restriction endonuclease subunit S n=1 Tax=Streptococcus pyogenes TaxID=1314 RepID=UPI0010A0EACE|nr:restriction endonuclease subunit S [Streptococcus pyogenes]VGQ26418.1 type I restriction modification DNA specificity domain-containing protein [Streptococcus pyogenes]VGQ76278.1 type I restriction modification DNA specificity domain-containing protein [Streptococcus pyogenes]VGV41316.1 type I restriction modification DNA specificity domain-containing protein [Streptococcus pyogenes]VGV85300.1 type I restriction modification DNA specificity domain-containing protein [Streptococcus pyogenes]